MVKAFNKDYLDDYIANFLEICEEIEDQSGDLQISSQKVEVESEECEDEYEESHIASIEEIDLGLCSKLDNVSRLSCCAYRLQLAINDSLRLDAARNFIHKISSIINKGQHSIIIKDHLREIKN